MQKNIKVVKVKCCKCKQIKDASLFYKSCYRKFGLSAYCIECTKEYAKKYQQSDKYKELYKKIVEKREQNKVPKVIVTRYKNDTKIYYGTNFKNQIIFTSMKQFKEHLTLMDDETYSNCILQVLNGK